MSLTEGAEAAITATIITDGLGLQNSQGIERAGVLVQLKMYGEYNRFPGCWQIQYPDAMANGYSNGNGNINGDGNGGEQQLEATMDAAKPRWGCY